MRLLKGILCGRIKPVQGLGRLYCTAREEKILQSTYKPIPIPVGNAADLCMERFDEWSDLPALECAVTERRFTYTDIRAMARRFGSELLRQGLRPGDKIGTMVPNCPEFGPILLGSLGVGVTLVPISPLLTPPEVSRIIHIARPKMIVTADPLIPVLTEAGLEKSELISVTEDSKLAGTLTEFISNDGTGYDSRPAFDVRETLGILPFSSGTTGPPKGVMLTNQNLTATVSLANNKDSGCSVTPYVPGVDEPRRLLSVIPMFHIFGLVFNVLQPLSTGAHMIIMPKFEPAAFISSLAKHQPTHFNVVPPLVAMMALNPNITKEQHLAKVKVISSGGSPLSPQIISKLRSKLSPECELKEGYGMTECPVVARSKKGDLPGQSVGKMLSNMTARVVGPDGRDVGPNTPGELYIRGPHLMKGYYNNDEANRESFHGDWFKTGDIVTYDEEGFFYIVDRTKDMMKVSGYQVSPTELENEIRKAGGVTDVAVIGVPDEKAGEVPRAFIVRESEEVTKEKIEEYLERNIAKYKRLRGGIVFLEQLPKSPTGKVLRKELRLL